VQLWDGCVKDKDASLQLLLIIDYIFDWAREIYRPSILRLLKSAAKGIEYDQVSLANNSDIFSARQRIVSWIPKAPTIPDTPDTIRENTNALDHGNVISVPRGETERSMYATRPFQTRVSLEFSPLYGNWPKKYRHYFRMVRNIWGTRYEEYMQRRNIDKEQINMQKARVKNLCRRARSLQNGPWAGEASWRVVEPLIFERFLEEVVW
jgi:hypothetical protein